MSKLPDLRFIYILEYLVFYRLPTSINGYIKLALNLKDYDLQ